MYFVLCDDSVMLPIAHDREIDALFVALLVFRQLAETGAVAARYLVVDDCTSCSPQLEPVAEVSAADVYSENGTRRKVIYRFAVR